LQPPPNPRGARPKQLRILVQQDSEKPGLPDRLGRPQVLEDFGENRKPPATPEAAEVWQQLATARNDDAVHHRPKS